MKAKGRPKGMTNLPPETVIRIRRTYAETDASFRTIARQFGLAVTTVDAIISGRTHKKLPGTWDPALRDYPITEEEAAP